MMSSVIGQDAAVSAVALAGVVHAATNVKRSPSLLLYGASGQGKTTIAYGLRDALRNAGYDLPFFFANAVDLTGNAWSGAPSINRLVEHAVSRLPIDSLRAQRMMGVIDELDKLKRVDHSGGHGNVLHRVEEQHSALLPLLGGGTISLGEDGRQYDASRALVICAGTFTAYDRARKLSMDDLVKYFPLELASRFEQMIEVQQLSENALIEIMQRWPALSDLMAVARTFGIHVHVEPAVFRRAARLVLHDGNTTPRTAAGYIVSALRTSVVAALNEDLVEIDVAPDSLDVPLGRSRNAEPPDGSSGFSQLWP